MLHTRTIKEAAAHYREMDPDTALTETAIRSPLISLRERKRRSDSARISFEVFRFIGAVPIRSLAQRFLPSFCAEKA